MVNIADATPNVSGAVRLAVRRSNVKSELYYKEAKGGKMDTKRTDSIKKWLISVQLETIFC